MSFVDKPLQVESIFDEMEAVLGADDRLGMWLCGPTFSSADVALTCLMFTLETLGLDEHLWKGGRRPNLAVYQVNSLNRDKIYMYSIIIHQYFNTGRSISLRTSVGLTLILVVPPSA